MDPQSVFLGEIQSECQVFDTRGRVAARAHFLVIHDDRGHVLAAQASLRPFGREDHELVREVALRRLGMSDPAAFVHRGPSPFAVRIKDVEPEIDGPLAA
jgi:hypothetical protein